MTLFDEPQITCRVVGCTEPPADGPWCAAHTPGRVLGSDVRLPATAGETQTDMASRRRLTAESRKGRILSEVVESPGLTDYDLEERLHERHEVVSAARNALMHDGYLDLHPDVDGKKHPLKRSVDGKTITVSNGPWECQRNNGTALLRWYPSQAAKSLVSGWRW